MQDLPPHPHAHPAANGWSTRTRQRVPPNSSVSVPGGIMRILILAVAAIFMAPAAAYAQKSPPADGLEKILAWDHSCDPSGGDCWFEKLVHFDNDSGAGNGGLVIDYDKADGTLAFISVLIPKDAEKSAGVVIRFIDSVKKNGKWALVPDSNGFLQLPVMECDTRFCQARVHGQIVDGPNLLEEVEKRNLLWVMFKRKKALVRFMVPLDGVHEDLRKLDLKLAAHPSGSR